MTKLNLIATDPPKGKFIAIYGDGSGAELFYGRKNGVLVSADGELIEGYDQQEWLEESGFCFWVPLPDDFELWFEQKATP